MSETNTPVMERRVRRAVGFRLGLQRFSADFEHGQWWVTELDSGDQWSVVDCETPNGIPYLDFEQVTGGEEE